MKIIVTKTQEEFDSQAAAMVARQLLAKPNAVLGFATGNTTLGLHRKLAEMTRTLGLDWSQAHTVNLDEFLGAGHDNPLGVYWRMMDQLLGHTNISAENVHVPDSDPARAEETCRAFPALIKALGYVDLQVLGIGTNAHIGMNDPGAPWEADMRVTDISPSLVAAKAHLWGGADKMPRQGITMGMRLILQGRTQLLMAKGADKAEAICAALKGPVTPAVPASALQLHPNVIVLLDEQAASLL